jgi:hypothetical protein
MIDRQTKLTAAAKTFYEAIETLVDSMGFKGGHYVVTEFSFNELMKARKEFKKFL